MKQCQYEQQWRSLKIIFNGTTFDCEQIVHSQSISPVLFISWKCPKKEEKKMHCLVTGRKNERINTGGKPMNSLE